MLCFSVQQQDNRSGETQVLLLKPLQNCVLIHYYMINNMLCFSVQQQDNGSGETQVLMLKILPK
jgi:hypothetical protein